MRLLHGILVAVVIVIMGRKCIGCIQVSHMVLWGPVRRRRVTTRAWPRSGLINREKGESEVVTLTTMTLSEMARFSLPVREAVTLKGRIDTVLTTALTLIDPILASVVPNAKFPKSPSRTISQPRETTSFPYSPAHTCATETTLVLSGRTGIPRM